MKARRVVRRAWTDFESKSSDDKDENEKEKFLSIIRVSMNMILKNYVGGETAIEKEK